MIKLEDIKRDVLIDGLEQDTAVRIIATESMGSDACNVIYKDARGKLCQQLVDRSKETSLFLAERGHPWSFNAPGEEFKLALEALRIQQAHLFDPMMAVHTSNVEPFPHQITAVYEAMLPRQPLRFVLADDPGAGKTIMAGLFIRELIMRSDAHRILIVAPGSLVAQWQDELAEKFGLAFDIFSREMVESSQTGNPFIEKERLIARLDQLSRSEEFCQKLEAQDADWDLVVVDEAHKLSARYYGNKLDRTKRYKLGELLASNTRHFLLMTATPHNGKETDFQAFLRLLDGDRFFGKISSSVASSDTSDLMRRMLKEELVKFDGTPLFPLRKAYTINYDLSSEELDLYELVTHYVKTEMNKADELTGKRKGTVGFALTILQRRLASSPAAIYHSLRRRRQRLETRVEEAQSQGASFLDDMHSLDLPDDLDDIDESFASDEYEDLSEQLVDEATAARTVEELMAEIGFIRGYEEKAKELLYSGCDRKWRELSTLLQEDEHMRTANGALRKLIIFTEHRDTLEYLAQKIRGVLGNPNAVVTIHGSVNRDSRREIQDRFRQDPEVVVLVATDAAGEGVNLQNAHLMVNYDLPWNPNRLEQRFGRIHRIGQDQVCHLWNLVAHETREGAVYTRLLEKLKVEKDALNEKVFNVLGEVFQEKSLRDMLIDAIRGDDDPQVQAQVERQIDGAFDREKIEALIERAALAKEVMSQERLFKVKEEMERAEARKLQPYFVGAFFQDAFVKLKGTIRKRESDRFEITNVPVQIREQARALPGRNLILKRYERVCFDRRLVRVAKKPLAELVHPGHPLMESVSSLILEQHRPLLKQGAILLDPTGSGTKPKVLIMIDHSIRETDFATKEEHTVSRQMYFITRSEDGETDNAGWAPHLDLEPLPEEDRHLIQDIVDADWLTGGLEEEALAFAAGNLVPKHQAEVCERRKAYVDKVLQAVHERLTTAIAHWQERYLELDAAVEAGKQPPVQRDNARRTVDELVARLERRTKELEAQKALMSNPPAVMGCALVIPAGLLALRKGAHPPDGLTSADSEIRKRHEIIAMKAVMDCQHRQGYQTWDVSKENCGWDITARAESRPDRHIEVKGRKKDQDVITVSRNEILYALNQEDKFLLAIVLIDEDDSFDGPYYVERPFECPPDGSAASINYDLKSLLIKANLTPDHHRPCSGS